MELKLKNGDYVKSRFGGVETLSGTEETVQRVLMRLTARRGSFYPLPEYGSELHKLCAMKKSDRQACAGSFVYDALKAEPEVSVTDVSYTEDGDCALLTVSFDILPGGTARKLILTVGGV